MNADPVKAKQTDKGWRVWGWHNGKRIDALGQTRRAAEKRWLDKVTVAEKAAPVRVNADARVGPAVEQFAAAMLNQGWANRRLAAWQRHQRGLAEERLRALDVPRVAAWRKQLDADERTRDSDVAFGLLRETLDDLVESQVLTSNRQIRRRRTSKGRTPETAKDYRPFTVAELQALLQAARSEPPGGVVWVMGTCGLRTGEALGLDWSAIEGNVLIVRQQLTEDGGKQTLTEALKTANSHREIHVADATIAHPDAVRSRRSTGRSHPI